jgi:DNA repair exonuclease SbcCD ATPase subunit
MYERQKDLIDDLITAQEELIKPLEEQKDAIDKQLSSFKEAIDLQKEALQLRKEEADFLDELTKKNKALANLEAEIAIASLDTSEEGIARRLKLEEEAAAAREDLAKTQEDREYDLQVRGLDDAYAAFEKGMNAQKALLDDQIAKIQEIIDKYNTQKEAIDALIVPLEAEKLRIDDIIYGLEQQKIPIEDAIFRLEQEKIRIEDLIYPLEQQKVALDELIYPLTLQQEAIDLIIHKYEDEKRAIEDLKQPIEDQIELIGDKIEVLQDELDLINEITKAVGGGGPSLINSYQTLEEKVKSVTDTIMARYEGMLERIGLNKAAIEEMARTAIEKYGTIEAAIRAIIIQLEIMDSIKPRANERINRASQRNQGVDHREPDEEGPYHEGGIVSKHGEEKYTGVLKESEIFAKLLKGEYVATEDQMKNFLRKTLPNMATEINKMFSEEEKKLKLGGRLDTKPINKNVSSESPDLNIEPIKIIAPPQPPSFNIEAIKIISPTQRSSGELTRPITPNPRENTYGDMSFEMNINVEGSLDKTVLPKLKKDVIKEINKSLERRGIRRTADSFAI